MKPSPSGATETLMIAVAPLGLGIKMTLILGLSPQALLGRPCWGFTVPSG